MSFHHRLVADRGEELAVDRLSKDLKALTKQTKATKYREVMKLLRLTLSGLQVHEDIKLIYMTDSFLPEIGLGDLVTSNLL